MNESIKVTYAMDRRLLRRGLNGWWRSAVPARSFIGRVFSWALIWGGLLVATLILGAFGIAPIFVGAGVIGAGVLLVGFAVLQRVRMRRFFGVLLGHWDKAGQVEVTFGPGGVIIADEVSENRMQWAAVDAVAPVRGATILRSGVSMTAIPDKALPEGMKPRDFRAKLEEWRSPQ